MKEICLKFSIPKKKTYVQQIQGYNEKYCLLYNNFFTFINIKREFK